MELKGIEKDEILLLLNQLNNQLEKLEADLHSSAEQCKRDWHIVQENRLFTCGEKLNALENKMAELEKSDMDGREKYSMGKITPLELGV